MLKGDAFGGAHPTRTTSVTRTHSVDDLRERLVNVALEWERAFGNAPAITSAVSEFDAAMLLGMSTSDYSAAMKGSTSVQRGFDFRFGGLRIQVKGTRPSGKPGSAITKVPGVRNFDWDCLVWISYTKAFDIVEAWLWESAEYQHAFGGVIRISPAQMRKGRSLLVHATR